MNETKKHGFFATRKGTPMGVSGDWWKYCDICGEEKDHPNHIEDTALLFKAIQPIEKEDE